MARTQGSARQEAERLVATVLAMATQGGGHRPGGGFGALGDVVSGLLGQAGAGHRPGADRSGRADGTPVGGAWATGSPECCVCPVCRVIAGLRDPSPETAERLATGAGDFATGVASLMRAFSTVTGDSTVAGDRASRPTGGAERGDNVWVTGEPAPGDHDAGAWAAATTAARDTGTRGTGGTGTGDPGSAAAGERRTGGDAWAAATATTGDPTATVPRRKRPAAQPGAQTGPAAQHGAGQHGTGTEPRTEAQSGPASWVRAGTAGRGDDPWAAATASTGSRQDPDHDGMDHGAAGHDAGTGDEARGDGVV